MNRRPDYQMYNVGYGSTQNWESNGPILLVINDKRWRDNFNALPWFDLLRSAKHAYAISPIVHPYLCPFRPRTPHMLLSRLEQTFSFVRSLEDCQLTITVRRNSTGLHFACSRSEIPIEPRTVNFAISNVLEEPAQNDERDMGGNN